MYDFLVLFLMFFIFSCAGWIVETIYMWIKEGNLTSRGFLIGPYIPVYGVGAICMILFLKKYLDDPIVIFFMAVIVTSTIEYITSVAMEKIFKARWWDYYGYRFNIEGRVCLLNSVGFGVLGLLLLYIVEPFVEDMLHLINPLILMIVATLFLIVFVVDVIVSSKIVFRIQKNTHLIKKDSTDEITRKVRATLAKHTLLTKRILKAFPKFKPLNTNISITTFRQALEKLELENKQRKLLAKQKKQNLKLKKQKDELKKKTKDLKKKKT